MERCDFKHPQAQQGVAMVEFAIALPLLLLLLLGVAEFGRMLHQYNSLLQANRDAVRYLAGQAWNANLGKVEINSVLLARTRNIAVYGVPAPQPGKEVVPGLTTANVTVGTVGAEHVQVSISYVFRPVIGSGLPALIGNAIPLNFPLVATTVMRGL
ncbi:TadE/TadG family type IV pilus assembly protein [Pseudomonas paeninsulae]|uniref:TadE/TadG family type IV pilus assembly protein n=1 Tax=Pseudomonas paeninsulae TaxID=3110772 RepID=UPI002D7A04D4|nr:TadE/TadG family type IV pilus assembly protein [Pseudomonas sp. IT1137]